MSPDADRLLAFWFAEGPDSFRQAWFRKDDAFDALTVVSNCFAATAV